jgi:hypothetical protein
MNAERCDACLVDQTKDIGSHFADPAPRSLAIVKKKNSDALLRSAVTMKLGSCSRHVRYIEIAVCYSGAIFKIDELRCWPCVSDPV